MEALIGVSRQTKINIYRGRHRSWSEHNTEGAWPLQALKEIDSSREVVNLACESKHRLDGLGILTLTVTVVSQTERVAFVVVRNFGANVLLGCSYADRNTRSINPMDQTIELRNGDFIPVFRRRASAIIRGDFSESKKRYQKGW